MTDIPTSSHDADEDRRKFLATCGKFAVVTPPAITLLLSTSLHSSAIAASGTTSSLGRSSGIRRSGGIRTSGGSWGGRKSS
jgi:hypothetical protein